MNSGRKHLPPPTELHYRSGQVVVLYAEDEQIRRQRRVAMEPDAMTTEATTSEIDHSKASETSNPPLDSDL